MTRLQLKQSLCLIFEIDSTNVIVHEFVELLIVKGIKPRFGGMPKTPAKLVVDLPYVDDETAAINQIFGDVTLMKENLLL